MYYKLVTEIRKENGQVISGTSIINATEKPPNRKESYLGFDLLVEYYDTLAEVDKINKERDAYEDDHSKRHFDSTDYEKDKRPDRVKTPERQHNNNPKRDGNTLYVDADGSREGRKAIRLSPEGKKHMKITDRVKAEIKEIDRQLQWKLTDTEKSELLERRIDLTLKLREFQSLKTRRYQ